MNRLALEKLQQWYCKENRKPMVIWGARQVGKTYLIKELFAKQQFEDYVYIDLKKDSDACKFFNSTCNPEEYLKYIETRYEKTVSNACPLIFDEVQVCSNVLTSLKYFCQDFPELPVIATGSMVRLAIRHNAEDFLFPVGKIESLNLFPLTFEEYLLNANKNLLNSIKDGYKKNKPLTEYEHEIAMDYLYQFLTIGGMPEVVDTFLSTQSYVKARSVLKEIYDNYLADMDQYNVSQETILKTRNVYKNVFSQLNKENHNFKISHIEKGKSNRDYFNAYQWLEMSKVVYRCTKKEGKVSLPLMVNEEDSGSFRIYLADSGLFTYQSGISQSDFFVKDKRNTLSGVFFENYIADELASKDIPLFFWTGKSGGEFEFIVYYEGQVCPVDVKKTKGSLNSLSVFRQSNERSVAVKISSNNFGFDSDNKIRTIPLYSVFEFAKEISTTLD